MKIEQEAAEFQPITITLETRGEAQSLLSTLGPFGGDLVYRIYDFLSETLEREA